MGLLNPINKSLCLEQVCASNYEKLFRLIPELRTIERNAMGLSANNSNLFLEIIEQSSHTLTIELSHRFSKSTPELPEYSVRIRLYLDVHLAEVLSDQNRPSVGKIFKNVGLCREIMNYKWRLNYFLEKWLDHCLTKNYQFTNQSSLNVELA